MVHLNTHKYEKSLRRLNIDMKAGNVIFHIFRAHNLFFLCLLVPCVMHVQIVFGDHSKH